MSVRKIVSKLFLLLVVASSLSIAHPVLSRDASAACPVTKDILGIPTWYKYIKDSEVVGEKCRPIINTSKDALPIGLAIFEIMLTLAGLVAVVMMFVGAAKFILTQGEPEKANAARKTIINALIGLTITIVATRMVSFIAGRFGG